MSGSIATRRLNPRNLLVFAIASLFSAPIFADQVVLDFGSLATPHIIPPTYTTPQFTVEKLGGSAEVRIASGTDSALWYLRNSFGWSATTSITLTEGGTFDFVSFRYESGAHLNGFRDVRGFSNGNLVATHLFETAALGTIDVSYNPAFQGIDEVQIRFNSNNPGVFAADDLTFDNVAIPEPSTCLLLMFGSAAVVARLRHRVCAI